MFLPRSSLNALNTNHIDLWFIEPHQLSTEAMTSLRALLSNEETLKLQQYKNKPAQHTSTVTRALCRLILAQYTNKTPASLKFIRNRHGKPELVDNINALRFNLSHNNELIVMVVCANDDIGCDIENPKRKISIEPISRRYFAKQEHKQLSHLTGEQQKQRFFEIWTLKEAFVKATGIGIALGLDTFYFDLKKRLTQNVDINFNDHYSLDKFAPWQCHQTLFNEQSLAICRTSTLQQTIKYFDAKHLLTN
ncbi:4'-phosphopantetheinyl transferase family protein [Psychromonas sp. L1A2]|uniref:4'-phosphopantetheinyl transferase family protein n=1 Tax=Psychromonas sp. L1A2 TaxID=2686356 RepID=UPI00135B6CC8|nr:4'-phosphopantetheinyl transferase superfamily protein [Psychromonas sp. L1A2]